jgi:carbon-monoxide dehydrogenase medium subunit
MRNFSEYHKPGTIAEASDLLTRKTPKSAVLAGGTWLVGEASREIEAVVDIAALGLDTVLIQGNLIRIGAAVTLQALVDDQIFGLGGSHAGLTIIGIAAHSSAAQSVRNAATIGGAIAATVSSADAVSPLVTALLACNAEIVVYGLRPRNSTKDADVYQTLPLSGFLSYGAGLLEQGALITEVRIMRPSDDTRSAYERIGRTPRDYPIVCAAVQFATKNGVVGNLRAAVGGAGATPVRLTRFELGVEKKYLGEFLDAELNAAVELLAPIGDFLGTAEYRQSMARVLTRRAMMSIAA